MKILSMKTSLSSSQKPNKLALQPIKACKTFGHFQLGHFPKKTFRKNVLEVKIEERSQDYKNIGESFSDNA